MPAEACEPLDPQQTALLAERYGDARGARAEHERLRTRLAEGDWITDDSVLTLAARLKADLGQRERDYAEREAYCAATRRLTAHHLDDKPRGRTRRVGQLRLRRHRGGRRHQCDGCRDLR